METEDSIPDPLIWTQSEDVGKKIRRAAGFHDYINSSDVVIGR